MGEYMIYSHCLEYNYHSFQYIIALETMHNNLIIKHYIIIIITCYLSGLIWFIYTCWTIKSNWNQNERWILLKFMQFLIWEYDSNHA